MKKRILSVLLVAVLAISALAGCGGSGTTAQAESNFTVPEGGYDGSEVTITFYNTMGTNLKTVLDLSQKAQKQTYFLKPNCLKQKIGE